MIAPAAVRKARAMQADSEHGATIVNSYKLLKDWTQNYLFPGIDVLRVSKYTVSVDERLQIFVRCGRVC